MARRIVFVHGIGDHKAGYSEGWRAALDGHLGLGDGAYVEAVWESALDGARPSFATMAEEEEVRAIEQEIFDAVAARQRADAADLGADPVGGDLGLDESGPASAAFFDWLTNPNEYIGDFARYLANGAVRSAVKRAVWDAIVAATSANDEVSVVAHSWGTVVAYDLLHDLTSSDPARRMHTLVTLGSPLWMWPVRKRLGFGRAKPANLDFWLNVDARGDPIGGWLHGSFDLDRDYAAPTPRGASAHSSYFAATNDAVLLDLVSRFIDR